MARTGRHSCADARHAGHRWRGSLPPGIERHRCAIPTHQFGLARQDRYPTRHGPFPPALRLFIDADACPVKDEAYRVAARYG